MSKAVLLSVKPHYCELIASGQKTVEVRKTIPKLETPFKCYIYCTKDKHGWFDFLKKERLDGKVIGEFVCDKIVSLELDENRVYYIPEEEYCGRACITVLAAWAYGKGKPLYGLHISDLLIYGRPKGLIEFQKCPRKLPYDPVLRPPQSWCYVEELRWSDA